jgi:CRISPR-associated endonuclease/helicase Cas3
MSYKTLVQHYESVCSRLSWEPRPAINKSLESLEGFLQEEVPNVILMELPTGYGKSAMTLALAEAAILGNQYFSKVIHVLPMRSIADDLHARLREWSQKLHLNSESIGVQHMGVPGSPFFAKKCVVVTLDTFMLNLFKAPAYELAKLLKHNVAHFEFPRGNIYSSIVVFDEFHLFSPMATYRVEAKNLGTAIKAIVLLALTGVPVIIMSATMPNKLVHTIETELRNNGVKKEKIKYEPSGDKFEETRSKKKLVLNLRSENIVDLIVEKRKQKKKVLAVINEVKNTVEIYKALREFKPLLLHGRLCEKVKKENSEKLKNAELLIATQVVEAGIDASFDVLISEICPPDRLIQRMGRVARSSGHDEGEVLIVKPLSERGVYDGNIINDTLDRVERISSEEYLSRPEIEKKLYEIMNEIYDKREPPRFEVNLIKALEMLDMYPVLDSSTAVKILKEFKGLTDSFGIVAAFDNSDLSSKNYLDYAVGLSEDMAKNALRRTAKVVKDGRIEELSSSTLNKLLKEPSSLSLSLIDMDFEGIIVEKIDKETGYVG